MVGMIFCHHSDSLLVFVFASWVNVWTKARCDTKLVQAHYSHKELETKLQLAKLETASRAVGALISSRTSRLLQFVLTLWNDMRAKEKACKARRARIRNIGAVVMAKSGHEDGHLV